MAPSFIFGVGHRQRAGLPRRADDVEFQVGERAAALHGRTARRHAEADLTGGGSVGCNLPAGHQRTDGRLADVQERRREVTVMSAATSPLTLATSSGTVRIAPA